MKKELISEMQSLSTPEKVKLVRRHFKLWLGTYSEGDIFLGLTNADEKLVMKKYKTELSMSDLEDLLNSPIHEHRRVALSILRERFERTNKEELRKEIYDLAMKNKHWINNWDLVDIFSPHVFWEYLKDKDKSILYELAKSDSIWDRRIAVISTLMYPGYWNYKDSFNIPEILLNDKENLIHKASWRVLRELGKNNIDELYRFLDKYSKIMPRTMLRYSLEKLTPEKRKFYMG